MHIVENRNKGEKYKNIGKCIDKSTIFAYNETINKRDKDKR